MADNVRKDQEKQVNKFLKADFPEKKKLKSSLRASLQTNVKQQLLNCPAKKKFKEDLKKSFSHQQQPAPLALPPSSSSYSQKTNLKETNENSLTDNIASAQYNVIIDSLHSECFDFVTTEQQLPEEYDEASTSAKGARTFINAESEDFYTNINNIELNSVDDGNENSTEEVIFDGCQITLGTSLLLVLSFCFRHNLSNEAMEDLLFLIKLHLKKPCNYYVTLRQLRSYFESATNSSFSKHYYCKFCFAALSSDEIPTCDKCKTNLVKENIGHHIHLGIKEQLERICKNSKYRYCY